MGYPCSGVQKSETSTTGLKSRGQQGPVPVAAPETSSSCLLHFQSPQGCLDSAMSFPSSPPSSPELLLPSLTSSSASLLGDTCKAHQGNPGQAQPQTSSALCTYPFPHEAGRAPGPSTLSLWAAALQLPRPPGHSSRPGLPFLPWTCVLPESELLVLPQAGAALDISGHGSGPDSIVEVEWGLLPTLPPHPSHRASPRSIHFGAESLVLWWNSRSVRVEICPVPGWMHSTPRPLARAP